MSEVDQPTLDHRIGTLLGDRYRVEKPLGRGGMGTVYRGLQLSVNRPVAIKLISGPLARNPDVVRRFRREAEAMAKLHHPHTVRLFEFGVTEQAELFLVMELLEGCDLAQHLASHGALSTFEALLVARHALESLSEAHALGIVHRDLKPANIFLSQMHGGQVLARLTDFGIASIQHAPGSTKLTLTGEIMGSPGYMSPEQALGKPTDARSDLYSLGATLFEMLTAKPVFDAESAASMLLAHATKPPPRLSDVRPDLTFDAALEQLVQRLLEKQPEARPQSAEETLSAIDELLRALPEPALAPAASTIRGLARTPTGLPHVQAVPLASETPQLSSAPPPAAAPESARRAAYAPVQARRSWTPAALAVVGALLLGLAAWKLFNTGGPAGALAASTPTEVASALEPQPRPGAPSAPRTQGAPDPAPEPPLRAVHIVSSPRNASVLLQGVELGKTPYTLQFHHETTLTLSLPGYEPATLTVSESSEPNIAVDLVRSQETSYSSARHAKRAAVPPAGPDPEHPTSETTAPPPAEASAAAVALPAPPPDARTLPADTAAYPPVQRYLTRRERQQAMLTHGSPYRNVIAAKRAYRTGQIDATFYDDVIWVLKTQRNNEIALEKNNYRRALITRDEYDRRVRRIKLNYEGE